MSTIGVSGLSSLYQSNSLFAPQVQTPDATATVDPSTDPSTSATSSATDSTQPDAQKTHHHHHGGGGGGGGQFFSKIQSAVTTALQSLQAGGAGSDPNQANQAIQNAIESVIKGQNGTSPDGTTSATTDGSSTDPTGSTSSTPVDPQTAKQAFDNTLQSYGVDPQQFHQDLLSAFQNAQNGNADPSSVFQSFPPGTAIDAFG